MDARWIQMQIPTQGHPCQTISKEMYQQFLVMSMS